MNKGHRCLKFFFKKKKKKKRKKKKRKKKKKTSTKNRCQNRPFLGMGGGFRSKGRLYQTKDTGEEKKSS